MKSLVDEGFVIVPSERVFDFANGVLDDGAPRPAAKGKRAKKMGRARQALEEILAAGRAPAATG